MARLTDFQKEQTVVQVNGNTKVKQLRRQITRRKTHAKSDSDLQDISSDSDNSHSDSDEENSDNKNVNNAPCNSIVTDNMKLLQDLEKEFYKVEAVGPKVEKVHYLKW